jgi:DNA primase large subunit
MQGAYKRRTAQGGVQPKRKCAPTLGVAGVAQAEQSAGFVNLYREKQQGDINLEQFERFAAARKRVLEGIDEAQAKGLRPREMHAHVEKLLRQYMPEPRRLADVEEAWATDHVSHFILRLAYSRTAELRKWFVRQEEVLLRYRFNRADEQVRRGCMDGLESIDEAEFSMFADDLLAVFG